MFSFAIVIGIYTYLIVIIGLIGLLTKPIMIGMTIIYLLFLAFYFRKPWREFFDKLSQQKRYRITAWIQSNKILAISLLLIIALGIVNLIGALGPELAFDALWYHLTLPKIYLLQHTVSYVPGGLLYYSVMPRLGEMLFTAALSIDSEILGKFIHFGFGILSCIAVYQLARIFFDKKLAIFAVLLFYSNLVVDWESTTAYIDLIRTFFETIALLGFFNYITTKKKKWILLSAIVLGFALSTKTLAAGSLVIFSVLIIVHGVLLKQSVKDVASTVLSYISITLLVVLPWFCIAYVFTGNPIYPLLTNYDTHQTVTMVLNPFRFMKNLWDIFTHASDPISPFYIITFPLLVYQGISVFKTKRHVVENKKQKSSSQVTKDTNGKPFLVLYCILALVVWYVTPQTGGGRYILPYLPALSVLAITVFQYPYPVVMKKAFIGLVIGIAGISLIYRSIANAKYLPVVFGIESKDQFLTDHLNFSFGDFYDTDHFFSKNLKPGETVLLYGFHNLYYVDFPFIDNSWVKPGDRFSYIAIQGDSLPPKRFKFWDLYYFNKTTHVSVYMYHHHQWIY